MIQSRTLRFPAVHLANANKAHRIALANTAPNKNRRACPGTESSRWASISCLLNTSSVSVVMGVTRTWRLARFERSLFFIGSAWRGLPDSMSYGPHMLSK